MNISVAAAVMSYHCMQFLWKVSFRFPQKIKELNKCKKIEAQKKLWTKKLSWKKNYNGKKITKSHDIFSDQIIVLQTNKKPKKYILDPSYFLGKENISQRKILASFL